MFDLLKGVRVLDLSTIVMGPMAGQILADLGAEVIKVEAPEGDLARAAAPIGPDGIGALFANNNRNKRSIVLDLKSDGGKEVLGRLVSRADVLLHNMRGEAAARLGFDVEAAMAMNPDLVYCAATGFGSGGPYAGRPAYDDVIQAAAGVAALPLETGREPAYVPTILADKVAALYAVQAIVAALFRRGRTGQGCAVEVPMFEVMAAFVLDEHLGAASFAADGEPGYGRLFDRHRRPFRTADGWIAALPYTGAHWRRVLGEIGRDDLLAEAWFDSAEGRSRNIGRLYEALALALPSRTTAQWLETLERLDVPHSPVNRLRDLLDDPHLAAVGLICRDDAGQPCRSVRLPLSFKPSGRERDAPAPRLGADGEAILRELGYDRGQAERLRAKGAFGAR